MSQPMTVDQVINIWLNGRGPQSQRHYRQQIELLDDLSRQVYGKSLLQLNTPQLTDLFNIRKNKLAPSTRAAAVGCIRGFYKVAHRQGAIKHNPALELRAPKFPNALADRLLTHEEVEKLLRHAETEEDRLLLQLLYGSGMRISEALGLRKKDLIGGGKIRVFRKGGRTGAIPVQPSLDTRLAQHAAALKPEDYLFTVYGRKTPIDRNTAHERIKRIARRAGMPQVSAHFFRHAHATMALRNGAPLPLVQKQLGHTTPTTTMVYLHLLPEEGAANYLPELKD